MASRTLLGLDIGSSSIKAALVDAESGKLIGTAVSPKKELEIQAPKPDWAEQDPDVWWKHTSAAVAELKTAYPDEVSNLSALGISYQMHGLVLLDRNGKVLRPSIIWCDSRAVAYGKRAFEEIGSEKCLSTVLNSPGNFTAAKLAWVKDKEPETFKNVYKFMLPGDYIAYRFTGEMCTTPSGLSEAVLWDAEKNRPADFLLDYFGFDPDLIPGIVPNFADQGRVSAASAAEMGIPSGIPVAYRAGDQPNNALSLNVLEPGELATTAGTSGVVYGIIGSPSYDPQSRVNSFVHVNHTETDKRFGVLMCVNGTAILNRWLRENITSPGGGELSYEYMNSLAAQVPPGSEGLMIFPYGNGAERTLNNLNPGASVNGLNFNIHSQKHLLRAGQEGIIFALNYGIEIMKSMGMNINTVKAGYANMFLSPLFRSMFASAAEARVELYTTDGAQGAARGAGIGAGIFSSFKEAFRGLELQEVIDPDRELSEVYREIYGNWKETLHSMLKTAL